MAVLVLAASVGRGAGEAPELVPMRVELAGGHLATYEFVNRPLRLLSYAGPIEMPLHLIRMLRTEADNNRVLVETTHGDQWRVEIVDKSIRHRVLGSTRSIDFADWPLQTLAAVREEAAWTPREHLELVFRDGSKTYLDPGELTLEVENEAGAWPLPLGSIRVVKILFTSEGETVRAIVRFPAGHIVRLHVPGRKPYFEARDTFGHALRVHYQDVRGLLCRVGIQDAVAGAAAEDATAPPAGETCTAAVTGRDGTRLEAAMPCVALAADTALGRVLLPTPQLRRVAADEKGRSLTFTTVYGDQFVGDVRPRSLMMAVAGADGSSAPVDLDLRKPAAIDLSAPDLVVPPGWFVFRLDAGDAFAARFADDGDGALLVTREGHGEIGAASLRRLFRTDAGDFDVTLDNGARSLCRPAGRSCDVVLLCNGMRHRLSWRDVVSVETNAAALGVRVPPGAAPGPPVSPPAVVTVPAAESPPVPGGPTERTPGGLAVLRRLFSRGAAGNDSEPSGPDRRGEGPADTVLPVKTGFGTLRIPVAVIYRVYSAPAAQVSSVTTTYGDTFVGGLISRHQARALIGVGHEPPELKQIPSVISRGTRMLDPPARALAWRLKSGDVFYAALAGDSLRVRPRRSLADEVDVPADRLTAIVPLPHEYFLFETRGGEFEGRPAERNIEVSLLFDGSPASIPFRGIEHVRQCALDALPPPAAVIPGAAPIQEGTVLLPGNAFVMGRAEGAGMDDEQPAHKVRVSPFFMDACEVTRAQFAAFAADTGYKTEAEQRPWGNAWQNPGFTQGDDEPVVCVTWFDAARYCNWRSERALLEPCYEFASDGELVVCHRARSGYRLPTEAEWEYAARSAGADVLYPWGSETNRGECAQLANYKARGDEPADIWVWTNPVRAFPANVSGLYGMGGNAWEWCQDWYSPTAYAVVRARQPQDPCFDEYAPSLTHRVMRGGSFQNELDLLRCASRARGLPHAYSERVGFRCVRNAKRDF